MKWKSQNTVTTSIDINEPDNPLLVLRNGNTLKFLKSEYFTKVHLFNLQFLQFLGNIATGTIYVFFLSKKFLCSQLSCCQEGLHC